MPSSAADHASTLTRSSRCFGLKQVFRLPLRALQGFAGSMNKLAFTDLPVPNYTMLCRRARDLYVVLPTLRSGEPLHLVIDSIGLKVFGEGEWKVRKHGYSKRRSWRKMHLAMDANTGQICAALMTHQDVGDGAYDTHQCHAAIAARGATPSIPPRDGAASWPKRTPGAAWRNGAIDVIGQSSRRDWKKGCGYHRRSLAKTLMYRLKVLTGRNLAARTIGAQATEVAIRVGMLNRMTRWRALSPSVSREPMGKGEGPCQTRFMQQRLSAHSVFSSSFVFGTSTCSTI